MGDTQQRHLDAQEPRLLANATAGTLHGHCPAPPGKLDNYRRTIAHKTGGTIEDFEEQVKDLHHNNRGDP